MSETLKITVYGTAELKRTFDRLARKVRQTILKDAVKNNSEAMLAAAKSAAPRKSGKLRAAIRRRIALSRRKMSATATISVWPKMASYGLSVEYGTGPRHKLSTGQYVGEMPAQPFMRQAFEAEAGRAAAGVLANVAAAVEAEASKP